MRLVSYPVVICLLLSARIVAAGQVGATIAPPPPTLPNTISRDESGHATVRAVRLTEPLRIDGVLDEPIYTTVSPMSGFYQMEPKWSEPASQKTEIWVFFDDK